MVDVDRAVELYDEGHSMAEVARQLGVSRQRMSQLFQRRGKKVRPPKIQHCVVCGTEVKNRRYCSSLCMSEVLSGVSKEEALQRLSQLARILKRTPTRDDVNASVLTPGQTYYHRYFGSLTNAQRLAGLKPNKPGGSHPEKSPDELMSLVVGLRDRMAFLGRELGHTPAARELSADGFASWGVYAYWFGSLREAQRAAGLVPNEPVACRSS